MIQSIFDILFIYIYKFITLIFGSFTTFILPGLIFIIPYIYKSTICKLNKFDLIFIIIGISIIFSSLIGVIFIYLNIPLNLQNICYCILLEYIILLFLIFAFRKEIYSDFKKLVYSISKTEILFKLLIVIIIIFIVTFFRYLPIIGKPPAPIHYDGCVCYFYRYLLQHNTAPPKIEIYGLYNQNINSPGGPTPVIVTLHVFFQKITNLPDPYSFSLVHVVPNSRHIIISIFLNIMIISLILAILHSSNSRVSFKNQCLAVLFTLLGSSVLIMYLSGWNAGYGFIYITSSLYLLMKIFKNEDCVFYKILIVIFLYYIVLLYHTASLVCMIIMLSLYIYSFIINDIKIKKVRSIAIAYSIFFIAYLIYLYTSFYGTILSGFRRIMEYIVASSIQIDVPYHRERFIDHTYITIYTISVITGAVPVLIYIYYEFKKIINKDEYLHILRIYTISYVLTIIVWFVYMGLTGVVHRGKEYLSYLSVFAFSILITKFSNKKSKIINIMKICVIIAIITSMYVYTGSVEHVYHLTESEYKGSNWLINHINASDVIFTDLRLSANFVANGYFKVLGILDPPKIDTQTLIHRLHAVFYGNNSTDAAITLYRIITFSREHIDYIFLSKRMAICNDSSTGIYGYDYQFKSAPASFMNKYDNCHFFNKIYCNGVITVYKFDYGKVKKEILRK